VEALLRDEGCIDPRKPFYRGRPVMITANDYNLRLFNGDVGLVLPNPRAGGELRVFFPAPDGGFRKFHHLRLPAHETVYAMTTHKSQGSEFDEVLLILPDRPSPVVKRELLYTGITRARRKIVVWGSEALFKDAIKQRIRRTSGLRDALWR
jgi:exodeoxyribonuclease V alpha subunit